jgi:Flp pilus assembly protein TadG
MKQPRPSFLRRFAADTRGNILIIVGLAFLFLVGIAGAGYDLGMRELLRAHTQRAADFAATSAGGIETNLTGAADKQMREVTAQRYFSLNFGGNFLGKPEPSPTIIIPGDGTITVDATGVNIDTKFVRNLGSGNETLDASGHSKASISAAGAADFDMAVVVDLQSAALSCLNSPGSINTCNNGASSPNRRLIYKEVQALGKLADKLILPNNANPNARIGVLGVGSRIRTAFGLTSNKAHIDPLVANPPLDANGTYFPVTYINGGYDLVHIGIYAAQKMLQGGMGVPNAVFQQEKVNKPKIDLCQGGFEYDQVDTTPYAPSAQTARSSPGDANNISKNKYVMYFHAGDTIAKNANGFPNKNAVSYHPVRCKKYASIWWNKDIYDPYVAEVCPNQRAWNPWMNNIGWSPSTKQCPQVLVTACDRIKANPSGTRVVVVDFVAGDATGSGTVQAMSMNAYNGELQQANWNGSYGAHNFRTDTIAALKACASPSLGGTTLPASIQPDPTKEYYIVSDDASMDKIMDAVAKQVRSVRIIE